METLSFDQIKEILENKFSFTDLLSLNMSADINDFDALGYVEQVSSGGFDQEEYFDEVNVQRTYYFKDHGIYIQIKGYFSSYGSSAYEEVKQVYPITKTIVVYE